jgi:hypothetical protein
MTETTSTDYAGSLEIRLCPACGGADPARSSCDRCKGAGLFDQESRPFFPPEPFNSWTPERLAALSAASLSRTTVAQRRGKAARLTQSQLVERLLGALSRGSQDHSTIELSRNAKGDTQIRVSVRTGEAGIETLEEARLKAEETYDHLGRLYPLAPIERK